jgi:heme/copper-type cytochrome/quinol oxidase subunit 3
MPLRQTIDNIAIFIFGLVGLVLFIISVWTTNQLGQCTLPIVVDGLVFTMTIGAVLVTIAVTYLLCTNSMRCHINEESDHRGADTYLYIGMAISVSLAVVLVTMGIQMQNEPDCTGTFPGYSPQDKTRANRIKFAVWFMFSCSLLGILTGILGLFFIYVYVPSSYGIEEEGVPVVAEEEDYY